MSITLLLPPLGFSDLPTALLNMCCSVNKSCQPGHVGVRSYKRNHLISNIGTPWKKRSINRNLNYWKRSSRLFSKVNTEIFYSVHMFTDRRPSIGQKQFLASPKFGWLDQNVLDIAQVKRQLLWPYLWSELFKKSRRIYCHLLLATGTIKKTDEISFFATKHEHFLN